MREAPDDPGEDAGAVGGRRDLGQLHALGCGFLEGGIGVPASGLLEHARDPLRHDLGQVRAVAAQGHDELTVFPEGGVQGIELAQLVARATACGSSGELAEVTERNPRQGQRSEVDG